MLRCDTIGLRFYAAVYAGLWFCCKRPLLDVRFAWVLIAFQTASESGGLSDLYWGAGTVCSQSGKTCVVSVGIRDYAGTAFACWDNHDEVVLFSAFKRISFVMLETSGFDCWRIILTALLKVSACSASSCLTADWSLVIFSLAGMFSGGTAKFRPSLAGLSGHH